MRNSFYLECSGFGQNTTSNSKSYLDDQIIDGTTEEILDLRKKVCNANNASARRAMGRSHWSNIPSGIELQKNFEKKYPGMKTSPYNSEYDSSFPYLRLKPVPQKPASDLLLYSNTNTYSYCKNLPSKSNYYQNSSSFIQSRPSYQSNSENRIRKALKYIDNASKILENY